MFYTGNLEKLVDRIFEDMPTYTHPYKHKHNNVKYVTTENGIKLALPGFSKEDLSIEAESGRLNISANIEKEDEFKKSFSVSFRLPLDIDLESMTASMENGILHIEYKEKNETKKVQIL